MGESELFGDGKVALSRGSRSPGVVGMTMLVRLLFAVSKPLLRMEKLLLVNTDGSIVLGDSSSGIVVS